MSQLLAEPVVGRELPRWTCEVDENDLTTEDVVGVFGVPSSWCRELCHPLADRPLS
jgi:hypothetical protein